LNIGPTKKNSEDMPVVSDGHTKILPVRAHRVKLDRPVLIAGFPDSGMIGSVTVNHIIEQLNMHQIGCIESQYVMPSAIFIGKRFRHPFRIYVNDLGTVCTLICEVPVSAKGAHSIINTIIDWCMNSAVNEIIVLGGILPTNFSPPYLLQRKAMLLRNNLEVKSHSEQQTVDDLGMVVPEDAIIVGLAGSLLSISAARGISCSALMIPTIEESPDPEGAAIILEALPKILPGLKIDTSVLREKVEIIKRHLEEFLKMYQQHTHEYDRPASRETERIYK
jgi:uncharacterized protein